MDTQKLVGMRVMNTNTCNWDNWIYSRWDCGLDDQYYKTLIIEYLKQYSKANRKEINKLLWDKLPDSLSDDQKKHKVHNLLTALKIRILLKRMEKTSVKLTGY